jgi:hypothetical protein
VYLVRNNKAMEPTLVFTKQAISRTSSSTGNTIDFFSSSASNIAHIGAAYGEIIVFFKDSNLFSDDSIAGGRSTKAADYAKVTLKVRTGSEVNTIELLQSKIKSSQGRVIRFDNVLKQYDVRGILQVINITRTELPTNDDIFLSCGTGGSSTDLDPGVIDVANDSFLFYDSDDEGLPKVETISDFIQSIAGENITSTNGVLSVQFPNINLPEGGKKYSILSKASDNNFDFEWTESPTLEKLYVKQWSDTEPPEFLFTKSRGSDHTNTTTAQNDILGQIGFRGISSIDNVAAAGKIKVSQTKPATQNSFLQSKFEFFVGTDEGEQVALSLTDERVTVLPELTTPPTAVANGLYANGESLFFAIN